MKRTLPWLLFSGLILIGASSQTRAQTPGQYELLNGWPTHPQPLHISVKLRPESSAN